MNREIKFRAWDTISNKIIDWDELTHYKNDLKLVNLKRNDINLKWMQFTGLQDKNGVDIYEKDFINCFYNDVYLTLLVEWNGSWMCFGCNFNGELIFLNQLDNIEIIGNIHSNPELLNDK